MLLYIHTNECSLIPQPRFIIKVCDCMKVFISHIIAKCCTLLKQKADLHVYCIRLNKVILTLTLTL